VLDPEVLAQLPQSVQLSILEKLRDAAQTGVRASVPFALLAPLKQV